MFYWILVLDAAKFDKGDVYVKKFQSLFYWILVLDSPSSGFRLHIEMTFQSLFYWILVLDDGKIDHELLNYEVSILVLLDFGFRPDLGSTSSVQRRLCFNPCSIGFWF